MRFAEEDEEVMEDGFFDDLIGLVTTIFGPALRSVLIVFKDLVESFLNLDWPVTSLITNA